MTTKPSICLKNAYICMGHIYIYIRTYILLYILIFIPHYLYNMTRSSLNIKSTLKIWIKKYLIILKDTIPRFKIKKNRKYLF